MHRLFGMVNNGNYYLQWCKNVYAMDAATRRSQLYISGHPQSCLHIRSKRFITNFWIFYSTFNTLGFGTIFDLCDMRLFRFIVTIRGCSWFVVESKIKLCVWFSESEWNSKLDAEMYGFNLCKNVPIKCHINTRHFDFYFYYFFPFLLSLLLYACPFSIFNCSIWTTQIANMWYVIHFILRLPKNIQ